MEPTELLEILKRGGAEAEVFTGSYDSYEVKFVAGEVKSAVAREASGLSVRAIKAGKLGYVGSRDTSPDGMKRLLIHIANSLEVGDPATFSFPGPTAPPVDASSLEGDDEATAALTVEDLVEIGKQAIAALKERHPEPVYEGTVSRSVGRTRLLNTSGVDTQDQHTSFSLSIEANRTQDEDVLLEWSSVAGPARGKVDPQEVVEEISRRLGWAEEVAVLNPGTMPVLFTPRGSLVLWGPLLQGLSGKTVMVGTSPLRDRVGEQLFDARIELVDDGLLPGGLGSAPFDDEGTPRRRRALIEDGVLRGFVHDLETSVATGQEPTGNGERGGATGKPAPGFSNLLIRGGERPLDELIAGMDYGLIVHRVMGQGQGNTLPGTFSNPVDLGYLVEKGEIKGRVKDVSIAGNIYELLLNQLGGLSKEVEQLGGSYHLPWVLLEDMNVVGKKRSSV